MLTTARRASIGAQRNPESEAAILDAAESLLTEHGLGGFSIEAVARRARAGKPTIYRWWPNRVALLLAVYARQKQSLPLPRTGSLTGDIAAFITAAISFWRSTSAGAIFRSVLAEAQLDPEAARQIAAFSRDRQQHMSAGLAASAPEASAEAIEALCELTLGYCYYRLLTGQLDDEPAAIRAIAERLTAGLAVK